MPSPKNQFPNLNQLALVAGAVWTTLVALVVWHERVRTDVPPTAEASHDFSVIAALGVLGLAGIGAAFWQLRREEKRRVEAMAALAESEQRFRLFYENSPVAYQSLDAEARILYVNQAWLRMLGYTAGEVQGRPIAEFLDPSQWPLLAERFARFKAAGRVENAEFRFRRKDGVACIVTVNGQIGVGVQGDFLQTHCVLHDITARKQVELALAEQAERFQALIDTTADGFLETDEHEHILTANAAYCRIIGYSAADLQRMRIQDLEAIERLEEVARHTEQMIRDGGGHFETQHRAKDGRVIDLEISVTHVPGRARFVAILRDVTTRKRMENALRESEARYRLIADNTGDVIWLFDLAANRFTYVSPSVLKLRGYTADEVMRQGLEDVMTPEYLPLAKASLAARMTALAAGDESVRTQAHEVLQPCKDGSLVTTEVVTTLISDATGRVTHLQGVTRNITVRRQAEVELRRVSQWLEHTQRIGRVGGWAVNRTIGRVWASPEARRLYGFGEEEIALADIQDIPLPEYRPALDHAMRELVAHGTPYDLEFRIRRRTDGALIDLHSVAERSADGAEVIGVIQDITEHKRSETALRESEERFSKAFRESPVAMAIRDLATGCYIDVNDRCLAMTGYSREETIGRSPLQIGWMAEANQGENHQHMTATAGVTDQEIRLRHKDGHTVIGSYSSHPLRIGGRPCLLSITQDVTERKRAEAAVAQSETRFRTMFQFSPFGAMEEDFSAVKVRLDELRRAGVTDFGAYLEAHPDEVMALAAQVRILMVNEGAARVLGVATTDPAAFALPELLARGPTGIFADEIVALAEGRIFFRAESSGLDAAGRPLHLDFTLSVQPGHEATLDRVIVSFIDISQRRQAEAGLRESEERFRTLVDAAFDGCVIHQDGVIVAANASYAAMFGYEVRELMGRRIGAMSPPEVWADVAARVDQGFDEPYETLGLRKDGTRIEIETSGKMCTYDSRPARIAAIRDLTARKQSELALRKLSRAVEQSPVTVVITDATGAIEYVNPSFTATTGYTLEEARGRNPRILKSGELPAEMYHEMWRMIAAGHEWRGEFHNRKKNGELFWEAATISPIADEAGRITHFLAVKEDITERKVAEDRIREQAALLEVTQDAILVLSLERVITFWNRGAEKLYGVTKAQALGRRYETIVHRGTPPDYDARWRNNLERGEWMVETRHVVREHDEVTVQKRGTLVRDAQGNAKSVLVVITDITEAKRLEAQFLRAQRLESLGSLASGVAHDLNNVLTPILMSAGMLADTARTPHERELIKLLSDSARRGADIVQQLLLFGRGSDSPRSPMSVGAVIKDMVQMMRGTFPKVIAVSSHVPKNLWMIDGDRTQIHQVMLNLCVNSRDAMPAGGKLTLLAENLHVDPAFAGQHPGAKPGLHVVIRVTDTGAGISAAHLEKIFDPFFTTKPTGQGTGLGLATVLGIVRSHGGFVTVESQEGIGTEFGVYLPARASAVESVAVDKDRPNLRGQGELVLVIDDEASIRSALGRVLAAHDYQVLVAGDGVEGVAVFVQNAKKIKLVITDVMMPVMDGAQAVRALRRLNPQLPVIAISGVLSQRAELESNFGPHIRFLPKPFLIEKALSLARELLDADAAAGK